MPAGCQCHRPEVSVHNEGVIQIEAVNVRIGVGVEDRTAIVIHVARIAGFTQHTQPIQPRGSTAVYRFGPVNAPKVKADRSEVVETVVTLTR